jgi:predicted methyltransferase
VRAARALVACLLAAACAASRAAAPAVPLAPAMTLDSAQAIVAAIDRAPEDRALDAGRRPAELLAFARVGPGMRVADLQAGGGYTAELLARAVGPTGKVFGQNSPFVLQRFAEKPWSARLAKPVMANVVRVDRPLDDPLPPDATGLDAVTLVLDYHDAVWQKVDRARMNAAIFRALKPGGVFVVVDHSARPGTGVADVETFHRIEEPVVKDEVARAGFQLAGEADFLRNPADMRDWNDSPRAAGERRGTSDRFVLKFVRP